MNGFFSIPLFHKTCYGIELSLEIRLDFVHGELYGNEILSMTVRCYENRYILIGSESFFVVTLKVTCSIKRNVDAIQAEEKFGNQNFVHPLLLI